MRCLLAWFRNVWNLRELLETNARQAALLEAQARTLAERGRSLLYCQDRIAQQRKILRTLLEPKAEHTCGKVRLRDSDEARRFAEHVEAKTLEATNKVVPCEPYACRICPRHPVTLQRFWHIRRKRTAEQRSNPSNQARRTARVVENQNQVDQRRARQAARLRGETPPPAVSPADIARLRDKFNQ